MRHCTGQSEGGSFGNDGDNLNIQTQRQSERQLMLCAKSTERGTEINSIKPLRGEGVMFLSCTPGSPSNKNKTLTPFLQHGKPPDLRVRCRTQFLFDRDTILLDLLILSPNFIG